MKLQMKLEQRLELHPRCLCCGEFMVRRGFQETCEVCFESAGFANSHTDGHHEPGTSEQCPTCQGVECMHQRIAGLEVDD